MAKIPERSARANEEGSGTGTSVNPTLIRGARSRRRPRPVVLGVWIMPTRLSMSAAFAKRWMPVVLPGMAGSSVIAVVLSWRTKKRRSLVSAKSAFEVKVMPEKV